MSPDVVSDVDKPLRVVAFIALLVLALSALGAALVFVLEAGAT